MSFPQVDQLQGGGGVVSLRRGAVRSAGELVEGVLAAEFEAADLLACPAGQARVGCLTGDRKAVGQVGDGVAIEPVFLQETKAFLAHGDTFPGDGWHVL